MSGTVTGKRAVRAEHRVAGARRPAVRGFTAVELLVTLAVVALLAAIGVPSFRSLSEGSRIEQGVGTLRAALDLARSEALARGRVVGLCRSIDPNASDPRCSTASGAFGARDWAAGWLVFAKAPGNTAAVLEPGDALLSRQPPLAPGSSTSRVHLWAPTADASLTYNWNGARQGGQLGSFAIDHGAAELSPSATLRSKRARCLHVNGVGRLDMSVPSGGGCR